MMAVTGFHRVGVLVFVGTLWFGLGNAFAVNYEDQLQPIPSSAASAPPPATAGPSYGVAEEETEFCGMPVCSPPGRIWLRADYLMWWTSGMNLPPLVTTSPAGTEIGQAGVLGQPGTTILFGGNTVDTDGRSGVRTTIGMWLDACHVWNLEFDYLTLGSRGSSFDQTSTGDPILARPFFNLYDLSTGLSHQDAELSGLHGRDRGDGDGGRQGVFPIGRRVGELQSVLVRFAAAMRVIRATQSAAGVVVRLCSIAVEPTSWSASVITASTIM